MPSAAAAIVSAEMEPQDRNPSTEQVAVQNLEMALNSTTAAEVLDMVSNSINSTSDAVAERGEAPSPSLPWTVVDTFGTFPKKARSRRRQKESPPTSEELEYLAECLAYLSRRNCSSGSSARKTSNSVDINPNSKPINNEKKRDFLETQNRSYECKICKKSFTTYQALGGHKASHSNKAAENNVVSTSAALHNNVSSLNPSEKAHVCTICHKSFNTGQALGGHKRLHYGQICNAREGGGNGVLCDALREQDMVQTEDLCLDKKSAGDVIVHNFDLNLLPQLEPASGWEEELNPNSETMMTEVSGDVEEGHLPMKKRCLTIKLDLQLSLPTN